jgi:hypothetical protein
MKYELTEANLRGIQLRAHEPGNGPLDSTFEAHYSIGDLAKQWRLGRETIRLLVKDEPGVLKIRMGLRKSMTRYSVPESVARRVHTKLFYPAS